MFMKKKDRFVDYIHAQLTVIQKDIGDAVCRDPEIREKKILEWIQKNAPAFREQWEKMQRRRKKQYVVE
jgi:hypothetical protein